MAELGNFKDRNAARLKKADRLKRAQSVQLPDPMVGYPKSEKAAGYTPKADDAPPQPAADQVDAETASAPEPGWDDTKAATPPDPAIEPAQELAAEPNQKPVPEPEDKPARHRTKQFSFRNFKEDLKTFIPHPAEHPDEKAQTTSDNAAPAVESNRKTEDSSSEQSKK